MSETKGMPNVARALAPSQRGCGRRAHAPSPCRRCPSALHRGVTLIELLVVITILAILAAAIYGATTAAMEAARSARTKSLVTKLNGLLMERWESYETRRVDIDIAGSKPTGQELAAYRLLALRLTMKLEMPDRWSDLLGSGYRTSSNVGAVEVNPRGERVENQLPGSGAAPVRKAIFQGNPSISIAYPPLAKSYLRRYNSLASKDPDIIRANQGAECLYMIIMYATGDGEARTLFGEQDIDDTDGDGAPEFVDGWGRPIEFVRWPTGYVVRSDVMTGDTASDPDPFDPFRIAPKVKMADVAPSGSVVVPTRYVNAMSKLPTGADRYSGFRLLPLIYSRGPDNDSDLTVLTESLIELDPYALTSDSEFGDFYLGFPADGDGDGDEGWVDNITNHNLSD